MTGVRRRPGLWVDVPEEQPQVTPRDIDIEIEVAMRLDADDDAELVRRRKDQDFTRAFYRPDRIVNAASRAICTHMPKGGLRGCEACRREASQAFNRLPAQLESPASGAPCFDAGPQQDHDRHGEPEPFPHGVDVT